jgi:dCMP deaminase
MDNINGFLGHPDKQLRWDERYMHLALHISGWSKDPKAKVGAVLANQQLGRIISLGFNGFPSNVEDSAERLMNGAEKLDRIIHAEQNALLFAGREARGCDLYVVGKPICSHCAILAIQSGVKRVIAAEPLPGTTSKWDKIGILAVAMLKEAGVQFDPITDRQLEILRLDRFISKSSLNENSDQLAMDLVPLC